MRNDSGDRIIYSICVKDIQDVSREVLGRSLAKGEIAAIENKVGDYIRWFDAIELAIQFELPRLYERRPSRD